MAMSKGNVSGTQHPIVPLPFDPRRLDGISERMIISHHENNYGGAVKNLNKVEEELARVGKDTPGFIRLERAEKAAAMLAAR